MTPSKVGKTTNLIFYSLSVLPQVGHRGDPSCTIVSFACICKTYISYHNCVSASCEKIMRINKYDKYTNVSIIHGDLCSLKNEAGDTKGSY